MFFATFKGLVALGTILTNRVLVVKIGSPFAHHAEEDFQPAQGFVVPFCSLIIRGFKTLFFLHTLRHLTPFPMDRFHFWPRFWTKWAPFLGRVLQGPLRMLAVLFLFKKMSLGNITLGGDQPLGEVSMPKDLF